MVSLLGECVNKAYILMRYGLDSLAEVHWICNGLREKDFGHFCIFECDSSESNLKAHPSASAENVLGNAHKFSGKNTIIANLCSVVAATAEAVYTLPNSNRFDGGGSRFNDCYSCGNDYLQKDCRNGSP